MIRNPVRWYVAVMIVAIMSVTTFVLQEQERRKSKLAARLEQVRRVGTEAEISCAEVAASRPLVLLALGQSNAGNHGSLERREPEPIILVADGKCVEAIDPLPGATGNGGSIWQRLPFMLTGKESARPIVMSVLAVDATSIEEWTNSDSPLLVRLLERVRSMHLLGLPPAFVLWQQGEANARDGTSARDYSAGLDRLAATIEKAGSDAPIILASSTICRSGPNDAIRNTIESKAADNRRFRLGPDTDLLTGVQFRRDGCHLTRDGLDTAARMWAASISSEVSLALQARQQVASPSSLKAVSLPESKSKAK